MDSAYQLPLANALSGRESANPCDFALVAMLGLLGLRISEARAAAWPPTFGRLPQIPLH
jgi:hypothetical protein